MAKPNPFAKFEKSDKRADKKEPKGGPKEGSRKEEAQDKMEMLGMKKGGKVKKARKSK